MKESIKAIQAFRGVAASAVIFHHAFNECLIRHYGVAEPEKHFFFNTDIGAAGVDLFFIISGFIMFYTTYRSTPTPSKFMLQRAIRIYPLYWIGSIAGVLLYLSPWVQDYHEVTSQIGEYVKSAFLYPTVQHEGMTTLIRPRPLGQGWTLVYEMVFYLVFASTLRLPRIQQIIITPLALGALWGAARLVLPDCSWKVLLGDPILLEFVFGIALASLLTETKFRIGNATSVILFLVGLAGLAAVGLSTTYWSSAPRLFSYGLPCFLCAAAVVLREGAEFKYPSWMLLSGDASYSLYLTHGLTMLLLRIAYTRVAVLRTIPSWAYFVLLLTAVYPIALASYFLLERPITAFLKKRLIISRPSSLNASRHVAQRNLG